MPRINAETLAFHITGKTLFFAPEASIHSVFRSKAYTGLFKLYTKIEAGTPTLRDGPLCEAFARKNWTITGVAIVDGGKIAIRLANSGRGRTCDYLSETVVLEPEHEISITRRKV